MKNPFSFILDKLATAVLARYEGAEWDGKRSFLNSAVQSARFDAGKGTRTEILRKARFFEQNSACVNRQADLFEQYTVGVGLPVMPASSSPDWNAAAGKAWKAWAKMPELDGRCDLAGFLSLAARLWFIEGEVFILLTRGKSGRPRVQLIESHMVETPPKFAHLEGESIIDGVIIDRKTGRPVGYYIATEDKEGNRSYRTVGADSIIHVFEKSRASQYRGLSFLYPVINDLHDLDDLQILEMKAAKSAAEITNVTERQGGSKSPKDLRRDAVTGTRVLSTGATVATTGGAYVQETEGGRDITLAPGEKMYQFKGDRPGAATQEFWRQLNIKICAGTGIPYGLVFPESIQGTVYRGVVDIANTFFKARWSVIRSAAERIFEFVMGYEIQVNRDLFEKPADWRKTSGTPPAAVNVDKGREARAQLDMLEAGVTTYAEIYGQRGQDWREGFDQLSQERAYAETKGLELRIGKREGEDEPEEIEEPAPKPSHANK